MKAARQITGTSVAEKGFQYEINLPAEKYKKDFPIFARRINGKKLVYLDNAATTQKPQSVIDAIDSYYRLHNANVHRGLHTLAEEATAAYEATRDKVAQFIGGVKREEIIYTRNATEAINIVSSSWGLANVQKGDRIVLTQMEHHANLVPWIVLSKKVGAELVYIPIDNEGYLDLSNINEIISARTKIVALTQMSNVLGTINPVEEIIALAHKRGAVAVVDGAQSVPHMPIDVRAMGADFLAFSAHKMLGPTGLGILYGREELLDQMEPATYGGEMIREVRFDSASWNDLPHKFEAGTPNIEAAYAFLPALEYLERIGMENIRSHEKQLTAYALERLSELDFLKIYGPRDVAHRGGAVTFNDINIHPHDLATFLDTYGIAVRAGQHCAQPLTKLLGVNATTRASFYLYNTTDDVDDLVTALKEARRYFRYE